MRKKILRKIVSSLIFLSLPLAACAAPAGVPDADDLAQRLQVIATTSIVGDVVAQIGGDAIDLDVMIPLGVDPHAYQATPGDIARVADADIVFINGAGLELFIDSLIENAGGLTQVISVSEGIEFLEEDHDDDEEAEDRGEEEEEDHEFDPHVWMDPNLVMIWADNIATSLGELDPDNAAVYQANAEDYKAALSDLDAWIREEVQKIPEANRLIVMDHLVTGYFSAQYGFREVGAIIPSFSTLAEPSASQLAELVDTIAELNAKAIFVSNTVSPALAERVAEDTATQLVFIYDDSLSDADGPAANYLDFMRYNVSTIAAALQ